MTIPQHVIIHLAKTKTKMHTRGGRHAVQLTPGMHRATSVPVLLLIVLMQPKANTAAADKRSFQEERKAGESSSRNNCLYGGQWPLYCDAVDADAASPWGSSRPVPFNDGLRAHMPLGVAEGGCIETSSSAPPLQICSCKLEVTSTGAHSSSTHTSAKPTTKPNVAKTARKNVLLLSIDDLRAQLGYQEKKDSQVKVEKELYKYYRVHLTSQFTKCTCAVLTPTATESLHIFFSRCDAHLLIF